MVEFKEGKVYTTLILILKKAGLVNIWGKLDFRARGINIDRVFIIIKGSVQLTDESSSVFVAPW